MMNKLIIGMLNYYSISFFIYTLFVVIENFKILYSPVATFLLFVIFIIDRTLVLTIICIMNKFRPLILDKKFIVSLAIFGYMIYAIIDAIIMSFYPNANTYLDNRLFIPIIVGIISYVIFNIIYIRLFSYFSKKRVLDNINPLQNAWYLLFKTKDVDLRRENYIYINVVICCGVFGFYILLMNILLIVCQNFYVITKIYPDGV